MIKAASFPCSGLALDLAMHPQAIGGVVEIGPSLFISVSQAQEVARRYLAAAEEAQSQTCHADALMRHCAERTGS